MGSVCSVFLSGSFWFCEMIPPAQEQIYQFAASWFCAFLFDLQGGVDSDEWKMIPHSPFGETDFGGLNVGA